jgi:putative inorganic carbon (HCO3(-)) transporter
MSASSISAETRIAAYVRDLKQMPCGMLLCFALLSNFFETSGHDRQRLLEVATLVLFAIAWLAKANNWRGFLQGSPASKPLTAFFLLGIIGSLCAFAPAFAFFEVSIFLLLFLFALAIAQELRQGGSAVLLRLIQMVAFICALHSIHFCVAYVSGFALGIPLDAGDFAMGFNNVRFFNHTQTPILPLMVLLCCVTPSNSRLRWFWWLLTAYWWMAIFATTGRGILVGIVGGCIAVTMLRRRLAVPYVKVAALTALLGLLAYLVLLVAIPTLTGGTAFRAFSSIVERTAADPASNRFVLWRRAIELIWQHPWFGVGPMHFAHHAGDLHTGAHPHDWIMQITSEWGIPALVCLCVTLIYGFYALLRQSSQLASDDNLNQGICSALIAGGAAILIDGLVSGLFVMPQSQLAVVFYLGCAIGWCQAPACGSLAAVHPSLIRRTGASVLVAAAAICLVIVVWPDIAARYHDHPLPPAQEALNTGINWPRLWHAGFF